MKRALAALGLAAALLAGCEDGTPERDVAKVKIVVPASEALKAMKSDLYRYLGLRRAVVDSGQRCKKVDRGAYQQDWNNLAMWTAHCTDTGDWALYIAPNGDVQASPCAHAKELGLPECRIQAGEPSEKR
jgi:hypothetical protein